MKRNARILFYVLLGLFLSTVLAWAVFLIADARYMENHPELMNEWMVFAYLAMIICFFYGLVMLFWSGSLAFASSLSLKWHRMQLFLLVVFALIPSFAVMIKSVWEMIGALERL